MIGDDGEGATGELSVVIATLRVLSVVAKHSRIEL